MNRFIGKEPQKKWTRTNSNGVTKKNKQIIAAIKEPENKNHTRSWFLRGNVDFHCLKNFYVFK